MAKFTVDKPITTQVPEVVVDAGLKPGLHRFRLVVVDDTDRASAADEAVVQVGEEEVTRFDLRPGTLVTATPVPNPTLVTPLRPTVNPIVTPPKPTQPRTRRRPR